MTQTITQSPALRIAMSIMPVIEQLTYGQNSSAIADTAIKITKVGNRSLTSSMAKSMSNLAEMIINTQQQDTQGFTDIRTEPLAPAEIKSDNISIDEQGYIFYGQVQLKPLKKGRSKRADLLCLLSEKSFAAHRSC